MLFAHYTICSKAAVPPELRHHLSQDAEGVVLVALALDTGGDAASEIRHAAANISVVTDNNLQ